MITLFYDVETNGFKGFVGTSKIVQLAGLLVCPERTEVASLKVLVKPEGFTIDERSTAIHGITTEHATKYGIPCDLALSVFHHLATAAETLVAFNNKFDMDVITSELNSRKLPNIFDDRKNHCAMLACVNICKLPKPSGYWRPNDQYKWPKLIEAHQFFFNCGFDKAHDALADVRATVKVHFATAEWLEKNKPAATAA